MKKVMRIEKASLIKVKQGNIEKDYEFCNQELGRGSFGIVYKARKKGHFEDKFFAVKKLCKLKIHDLKALTTELRILRAVDHPSIIKLHEVYDDEKFLYLVTDLCEGGELFSAIIQNGSFSEKDARYIFTQIIEAIGYCHQNKIAHRDLKPENFLFRKKGSFDLSLIDFGLAYQWKETMKEQIDPKSHKRLVGTSYYIAPEVLKGSYDQRCDIWAAGVILYILVSGRAPFEGANDKEIFYNVYNGLYSLNIPEMNNLSIQLKDLIYRLLQLDHNRLTIEQIYKHPWMKNDVPSDPLKLDFSRMQNYAKFSKFKKIIANYVALYFSSTEVEHLGKLFKQIDSNHDGLISLEQLIITLEKQKEEKTFGQVKQIIDQIDGHQKINYTEFLASTIAETELFREETISYVFNMIDTNKNGVIDREQLEALLKETNFDSLCGIEVEEILEKFDMNNDGAIDFPEFLESLKR